MQPAQDKNQEAAQKKNSQQYHQQAAELHELAFKHHLEASKFYKSGDDKAATHHAELAHGHARQAIEQKKIFDDLHASA